MKKFFETQFGNIYHTDSLKYLPTLQESTINLIMTSPPFGLVRKKDYGNADAHEYLDWFRPFAKQFKRILRDDGSLVIDIGGAWIPGQPTRSLYHYELMIMLCREYGFHLAQDFFWWNPSKLPTPAEWVNIRRIRVKDAINCVWWLSKTPWPKASNRRILVPYSESMKGLLKNGYQAKLRPSGHDISNQFAKDNGASIPPNLIAIANTESNSSYLTQCKEKGIKPHPARFPVDLPEYFIRMLTDKGDFVLDPFAGSCGTGEAAERLKRKWTCLELNQEYIEGGMLRFPIKHLERKIPTYNLSHPAALWNGVEEEESLPKDGGKNVHRNKKIQEKKMPAIPSNQLINEIIYAIQESGGIASYVSENARTHPRKFVFSFLGNSYSLWVYIWTLTPGGRVTLPDEYRIQMTGVSSPLQKNPEGLTVLMGYYPDLKIFAGFDITKHSQFTAGSPSVQIDISAIYSALQHGLSFVKKDNNEIAIGVRPDLFLTYCLNGKVLHLYGAQSNITEILTQAVELQEVSQKEFSSLPANRKRIIQKVSKYSRDANFRKIVLNAYDNRCAVTRTQLRLVDAAHILPVASRESSDDITNGIALSPTFHRAYDHCLIYLDENYVMKLNTEKSEELTSQNLVDRLPDFKIFLDKKIHLPLDVNQRPNVQLI